MHLHFCLLLFYTGATMEKVIHMSHVLCISLIQIFFYCKFCLEVLVFANAQGEALVYLINPTTDGLP